jgi:transketolase
MTRGKRPRAGTTPGLDWAELDRRAVDVCRALALDAVEAAGSGHPGTAMALAPQLHDRLTQRRLPAGWQAALPTFEADEKGVATRSASGDVLSALAPLLPELWGGSADLAGSNNTTPEGALSFLPEGRGTKQWPGIPDGRVLHFGVREHAMGSAMNGATPRAIRRDRNTAGYQYGRRGEPQGGVGDARALHHRDHC